MAETREWQDLDVDDITEMIARLDMKRKSRIWFGDDTELLNALCRSQAELEKARSELVLTELRSKRRDLDALKKL